MQDHKAQGAIDHENRAFHEVKRAIMALRDRHSLVLEDLQQRMRQQSAREEAAGDPDI